MRISFDIDDTLVCREVSIPAEPGRLPHLILQRCCEPIREGTCTLFAELHRRRWDVWIYTTSERTLFQIWLWLLLHDLRVDGIVNGGRHRRELSGRRFSRSPSKYPPAFGIDLHVDDSEGVRMEGDQHGFRVVVVQREDRDWTATVLNAAAKMQKLADT